MPVSSTSNIKMGTCKISLDGVDLGLTMGGVDVEVSTTTHETKVDQFGDSVVNERIMGRNITVKCPLAETTLDNMAALIPGATMVEDGVKASGTVTFSGQPSANETITVKGVTFTFKAAASALTDLPILATLALTLAAAPKIIRVACAGDVKVVASATVLTVTAATSGVLGNTYTLAKTATAATVSGATLTGGTDSTKRKVEVTNAVGTDLLAQAKELILHPIANAANNLSEDLVIPLAATAGQMNFAYKYDTERVFNCEFKGYPDNTTGVLFIYGNKTA